MKRIKYYLVAIHDFLFDPISKTSEYQEFWEAVERDAKAAEKRAKAQEKREEQFYKDVHDIATILRKHAKKGGE